MNTVTTIVIGIIVLVFILYRQLQERPIKEERGVRLPLILAGVGVIEVISAISAKPTGFDLITALLLIGGILSGAVFGWIRARNIHLWYDNGKLMRQGSITTIILWVVGLGIHLGLEHIDGKLSTDSATIAGSSLLLYIGISLGVQRYVTLERAKAIRREHRIQAASSTAK